MNENLQNSRRGFLKTAALAGVGLGLTGFSGCATGASSETPFGATRSLSSDLSKTRKRPAGQKPVFDLTTTPKERVRVGLIGLGQRGGSLINDLLAIEFVDVVAICDVRQDFTDRCAKRAEDRRGVRPKTFAGTEHAWEELVAMDDIDVVYVATPWEWHVPMCVKAMESGKHAFVEVAAAVTIDECWKLVDVSERTQKHCSILENCCYGRNELFVLNMARQGVFGDLTHAECAYIHDLRGMLFLLNTEGDWRREYHKILDGNLYPTHGLGPVCQYMDIGRGDNMKYLVSASSPERGLSKWLRDKNPNNGKHAGEKYICGDMNTSLIKTELGRTIMIQHDVISPRPYSRINALSGTGATFFDYPARLAVNDSKTYGLDGTNSHRWMTDFPTGDYGSEAQAKEAYALLKDSTKAYYEGMKKMREKFEHPLWAALQERAKASGHGGMDFVMSYRLLDCIRKGITPDTTVYDTAMWSCIIELSAKSVETGGSPVAIPDFTRGAWKTIKPLEIAKV